MKKEEVIKIPSPPKEIDYSEKMMGHHLSNAQVSFKDFPASDSNKLMSYNSSMDLRNSKLGNNTLANKLLSDIE